MQKQDGKHRVLQVLDLGDRLLDSLPDPRVRPIERVKLHGRYLPR